MAYRKGVVLSFGAITAVVDVESAVGKPESLTTVCVGGFEGRAEHAPTPIKQTNICKSCGDAHLDANPGQVVPVQAISVPYPELQKAKQEGESFVVVTQDEVAAAKNDAIGATKKLLGLTAHNVEDIERETLNDGAAYYLKPSDTAQGRAYGLFVDTLQRHPEVGFLGLWTPSSRQNLYRLTFYGNALVLEQRNRSTAIKVVDPDGVVEPDEAVRQFLDAQLSSFVQPFNPVSYEDTYQQNLDAMLAERTAVTGVELEAVKATKRTAATTPGGVDLMAQLQAMAAGQ